MKRRRNSNACLARRPRSMPSRQVAAARQLLAELLSARGKFEEAARHLTQAVESQPIAFEQLTAVKRMTEADRPLIDRVRLLAEAQELEMAARIHINFGLGKAFDDLGEYAEAMRHYEVANGLRASSMRLNRAAVATWFDTLIKSFTAEALSRARQNLTRPAYPGDDLPVFIVGHAPVRLDAGRADPVLPSRHRRRRRTDFLAGTVQRLGRFET